MKRIVTLALILTAPFFLSDTFANSLGNKINNVISNIDKTTSISILVTDQRTGKIIYQKNPDRYFMPASNEKLFTAFAALFYLGNQFTYQTQLFADTRKIKNGVLYDNVYLKFSGDPTFTSEQLNNLILALPKYGIKQINGNIVIDDTTFDQMSMSPGSTWDDKDFCWGAPVHAINIDSNCVRATLTPSAPGQLAALSLPDQMQSMQFINHVVTGNPSEQCIIRAERQNNAYIVSGCIDPAKEYKHLAMAIDHPRSNIQYLLSTIFFKNHIINTNKFEFRKITQPPALLATEASKPLPALISTMLKNSDNLIANSLFKTIGAVYAKDSGSFKNGSDAVRAILLQTMKLDIPKTTLIDGSGGSRYDFLTPQQIVTLLQNIVRYPQAASFVTSLPISGTDGTLKARMNTVDTTGKVYAKTGTATAVSNLSGYLITRKQHKLIFSIMMNGFVDMPTRYEALQDQICATLIENA